MHRHVRDAARAVLAGAPSGTEGSGLIDEIDPDAADAAADAEGGGR
jgi:hypothetical protein